MYESFSLSHQGMHREGNEDSVFACPDLGLWLLADGVGGHGNGEIASQLAVQTIERSVRSGMNLADAIFAADQAIQAAGAQNPEMRGMATTIVACRVRGKEFELAWVGDSRAYRCNGHEIEQLTEDHAVTEGGHELTQALGFLHLESIPTYKGCLRNGDTILLCSDGLSGVLDRDQLLEIYQSETNIAAIGHQLIDAALARDTLDNVSVVLLEKEQSSEYDEDEVVYRSPFDRSRYDINMRSRPIYLLLVLIAIFVVLTVL
jgi:serine/threonine protein phosphatase PrpC